MGDDNSHGWKDQDGHKLKRKGVCRENEGEQKREMEMV